MKSVPLTSITRIRRGSGKHALATGHIVSVHTQQRVLELQFPSEDAAAFSADGLAQHIQRMTM